MMLLQASVALIILMIISNPDNCAGAPTAGAEVKDPVEEFSELKAGLKANKEAFCSFLLKQNSSHGTNLSLKEVSELFEEALDHLGKSSDYATFIKTHLKNSKVIEGFDTNGGNYVLEISDNRRSLLDEYRFAEKLDLTDEAKNKILEKYFYKACSSKLGTIITEKSMYDSMLKLEAKLNDSKPKV